MCETPEPPVKVLPYLDGIEYTSSQNTFSPTRGPHSTGLWKLGSSCWRNLVQLLSKEQSHSLLALPTEIIQLITSELPAASRASFSLTCKSLLALERDTKPFQAFTFPSEQPHDFHSTRMNKASNYQPARWDFLCFLERDLNGEWLLCSECFTLHPRRMFAEYRRSIVPWLEDYYTSNSSDFRGCRQGRRTHAEHLIAPTHSGIVDLCPCIKITMGQKRLIEDRLREKVRPKVSPAADFWWHECRHVYGAIEIDIKIRLFLYDGTERRHFNHRCITLGSKVEHEPPLFGHLGVLFEYRHKYPSSPQYSSPRLLCPHRNLHITIQHLLQCRERHYWPGTVCRRCSELQNCTQCRTKIFDLKQTKDTATGIIDCSYRVERCLDSNLWPMHTIFPFARRQIPLRNAVAFNAPLRLM